MKGVSVVGLRRHRGEQEWQRLIAEQERSGLSLRAFCEREGLCAQSLRNWKRRLGAGADSGSSNVVVRGDESRPAFVEIAALSRPLDAGVRVRLELGAGIVLELSRV